MSRQALPPRSGGPGFANLADLFRWAWHGRAWTALGLVLLVAAAALVAGAGQLAVPWIVYGGL